MKSPWNVPDPHRGVAWLVAMLLLVPGAKAQDLPGASLVPTIVISEGPAELQPSGGNGLFKSIGLIRLGDGPAAEFCSGSLLAGGAFMLTSAHCLTGNNLLPIYDTYQVRFADPAGTQASVTGADRVYVHPQWTGDIGRGNDLALLRLDTPLTHIQGLQLSTAGLDTGEVVDLYGFGDTGFGSTGATHPADGRLRTARNRIEVLGSDPRMQALGYRFENLAFYDFDSGTPDFDTFGRLLGLADTGLSSNLEGSIAAGDSGGPTLLGGRIVGVHSFVLQLDGYVLDRSRLGSWGEIGADAMVYPSLGWIEAVTLVPEPASLWMLSLGFTLALGLSSRRLASRA